MMKMEQNTLLKNITTDTGALLLEVVGCVSAVPNSLGAAAFDLCFTAGPGEDVSVGSCRRLISPSLTQAQLVDSTLWHFARKVVRAPSDKSLERIPRLLSQA